jgi:N4-gp56 family major capsid protein
MLKRYSFPAFNCAIGVWDNVIIHEHENVKITATGAASVNVAHNLFLGAQAGAFAVAQETDWAEDPTIDYGNQVGFATGMIYGIAKSKFNEEDFGMLTVKTGAKLD